MVPESKIIDQEKLSIQKERLRKTIQIFADGFTEETGLCPIISTVTHSYESKCGSIESKQPLIKVEVLI